MATTAPPPTPERQRRRLSLAAAAAALVVVGGLILVLAISIGMFGAALEQGQGCGGPATFAPSQEARGGIPTNYLALYINAEERYDVPWEILAAVGRIETNHGRSELRGVRSGENFAGAGGPMQFLAPTWTTYGVDGDRDGDCDRYDPRDAIPGAANYLRASGAPGDIRRALFSYNHAWWYVEDVLAQAAAYRGTPESGLAVDVAAGRCPGGGGLSPELADVDEVLRNPRINFGDPQMLTDLRAGRIDARIIGTLAALAEEHQIVITSLLRPGDFDSNHSEGRAMDIGAVDGVSCTNTARSAPCGRVAQALDRVRGPLHSTELIYLFDPGPSLTSFADPFDHHDHVHVGFDR